MTAHDVGDIAQALLLTVELFVIGMALGTAIAIPLAFGRNSRKLVIAVCAGVYSWFWRVMPLLFILYFGFFGLPALGVHLSAFITAAILIALSSSAYIGEIILGGLQAIPDSWLESARALGLPPRHVTRRIVLPHVARIVIGPYMSQSMLVLQGTSLAGIVGVFELTGETNELISSTFIVWPFLITATALYLAMSLMIARVQRVVEKRWHE